MCVTRSPVFESIDNHKSWCNYANTHRQRGAGNRCCVQYTPTNMLTGIL